MPTCQFSFIYKGKQLCVLEESCAFKNPKEQQTCQDVHKFYNHPTPNEVENLRQRLIYKLEFQPTLKFENLPSEIEDSAHTLQIDQSKEKLKRLHIKS